MANYWRVFPWDVSARPGAMFSPSFVPSTTGRGRFDLSVDKSPVLYVAESPEHAIAEALQSWRNRPLRRAHLERARHPLALVEVAVEDDRADELLDLCDPRVLTDIGSAPDEVASRHRGRTQPIAAASWDAGRPGLRWWSAFWGDWHGVVLFTARLEPGLHFARATPLSLDSADVRSAAAALGMEIAS